MQASLTGGRGAHPFDFGVAGGLSNLTAFHFLNPSPPVWHHATLEALIDCVICQGALVDFHIKSMAFLTAYWTLSMAVDLCGQNISGCTFN